MGKYQYLLMAVLILLLLNGSKTFCQRRSAPRVMFALDKVNGGCLHRNKYTIKQRLSFYPFNKANYVQLVSFYQMITFPEDTVPQMAPESSLPIIHDTVDYSQLREIKKLTRSQVNQLTDLLFNVGFTKFEKYHIAPGGACYDPKNAILFVDGKGHTFAFIEICFHCHRNRPSTRNITLGDICIQKYGLIQAYFASEGLKIGTSEKK